MLDRYGAASRSEGDETEVLEGRTPEGERLAWALPKPSIVFAGSGTAGHLNPGLEVARRLVASYGIDRERVSFVGGAVGTGADVVEAAGFTYRSLPHAKPLRGRSLPSATAALLGTALSVKHAAGLLEESRASLVVGIGGYASVPMLIAARRLGVAVTVLQEDATLGLGNSLGVVLAEAVPYAFPASLDTFARHPLGRVALRRGTIPVEVAPMVSEAIRRLRESSDRAAAKERLGLDPERPLVSILGGSLGAEPVNRGALRCLRDFKGRRARSVPQLIHVTGRRYFGEVITRARELLTSTRKEPRKPEAAIEALEVPGGLGMLAVSGVAYLALPYVRRMERLYEASDLVVSRAGATTVGELVASATPAVLMPSSYVAGLHQHPNALAPARRGAAVILEDSQAELLPAVLDRLLGTPSKLEAMRERSMELGTAAHDASEVVAELAGASGERFLGLGPPVTASAGEAPGAGARPTGRRRDGNFSGRRQ